MLLAQMGFRMPAEWEKRARTFMEWPVREEIWPDGILEAKIGYANVAKTIAEFEEVVMIVRPELVDEVRRMCGDTITLLPMEHDDSWMRDNGPTFVINPQGEVAAVNWKFNAWGDKYKPYDKDNEVAGKVLKLYNIPRFDAPMVLEGGSIHVDGEGTLITTEECLLNKNRNPELNKNDIEKYLAQYLAVQKVIWLKEGLYGDETDGHVDNVACFAKPGVIVMQVSSDKLHPNYSRSQENLRLLKDVVDANGRVLEVVTIEQPPARQVHGKQLTLSYLNYYPVRGGVIVPVFGGDAEKSDQAAIRVLQQLYSDRRIMPVDGIPVIKGGGNVHCITQQMPAGVSALLKADSKPVKGALV
jgi:agmatine deiminase